MNEGTLCASSRLSRLRRDIRGRASRFRKIAVAVVAVAAVAAGGLVCAAGSAAASSDSGVAGHAGRSAVASAARTANVRLGKSVPTRAHPSDRFTLGTGDKSGPEAGTATTTGTGRTAISAPAVTASLAIVMSTTTTEVTAVGQVITYSYQVTNTGGVSLAAVGVTDAPEPPAGALTSGPACQSLASPTATCSGNFATILAAGQSAAFTATYTVTQADMDSGLVERSADTVGLTVEVVPVEAEAGTVSIPVDQTPALAEVMSLAAGSPDPVTTPGQMLTYDFAVTNTGNVTLSDVGVNDTPTAPASALTSGPACQSLASPAGACSGNFTTTLAPGQVAAFTATYTVTQADIDYGSVNDSAIASGEFLAKGPPNLLGLPVSSAQSTVSVPAAQTRRLTQVISLSEGSPDPVTQVGQVLTYVTVVTNTGNVTLTDVSAKDSMVAPAGALTSGPGCQSLASPAGACSGNSVTLVPGQTATFTATYTVTQADITSGSVTDSATATGTPPSGPPVTTPPSALSDPAIRPAGLTVVNSLGAGSPDPVTKAGQVLTYDFKVTNSGGKTLTAVGVTDTQGKAGEKLTSGPGCQSLASPAGACSGNSVTLVPGQTATFTATYTVTQADITSGSVTDSATATGTPPSGPPVTSPPSKLSVPSARTPGLTLVETLGAGSPDPVTQAGQLLTFDFKVTNTGNETLTHVTVTDPPGRAGASLASGPVCRSLASPAGACSGNSITLVPGQSAEFTATYIATQADVDSGSVTLSATVTGTPPGGSPVTSRPSRAADPAVESVHPKQIITDLGSPTGLPASQAGGVNGFAWGAGSGLAVLMAAAGLAELRRRRRSA